MATTKVMRPVTPGPLLLPAQPKATPPYIPLLYLSEISANGIQWPRTAIAHTSEIPTLVCEFAGQREVARIWRLGNDFPGLKAVSPDKSD
jgi:hypothetical protein